MQASTDFQDYLRNTLRDSFDDSGKFSATKLFFSWFRKHSTPYYFLFKKNLSCTNIQFSELLALVRVHANVKGRGVKRQTLHFVTRQDFLTEFCDVAGSLSRASVDQEDFVQNFSNLYEEVLRPFIVIEPFFGSCTLFMPPHLELDLFHVCAESGYIHSCGHNVYTGKLDEAHEPEFLTSIHRYVNDYLKPEEKTLFRVYAHEDFPDDDHKEGLDLRAGLDDVKIYLEKYYLSDKRLVEVIQTLKDKHQDRLVIPIPRAKGHNSEPSDRKHTIWLIVDRSVGRSCRFPGDDRFLICYDQLYKNENAFQIFDENKPAWICHTTMPHTLAGALINITRPWWNKEQIRLADPFAGTGTVWLESLKLFPKITPDCADLHPLAPLLASDNLEFFSRSKEQLEHFDSMLKFFSLSEEERDSEKHTEEDERFKSFRENYTWAKELIVENKTNSSSRDNDICEKLKNVDLDRRFLVYLWLRASIRHGIAMQRGTEDWELAFDHESKILRSQIQRLCELKKREMTTTTIEQGMFSQVKGRYSDSICISTMGLSRIAKYENQVAAVRKCNAVDFRAQSQEEKFDVVITDPPYGFNTDEDPFKLASLYAKSIRNLLESLNDGGQLVLCLPDRSHTGRSVAGFSTQRWVISQVLAEAQRLKLEAIWEAQVLPSTANVCRPPYYWESERALRRAILHFRFRRP